MNSSYLLAMCAIYCGLSLGIHTPCLAIDEFGDLQIISKLPSTDRDVAAAFDRSRGNACEIIPAGESLEIQSFMSTLTERDRLESTSSRPLASSRRDLFSVGLELEAKDRDALPALSRGSIVDYLAANYVSVQARVRRDLLDRKLYFHHRPLALTAQFRGSKLTQSFEPLVSASISEFHSLGLFVPADQRLKKPEHFRTIVLLFHAEMLQGGLGSRNRDAIEYVFIRGRDSGTTLAVASQLETHIFVTTENRTRLEYLRPASRPVSPSRCSILGRIAVTDFDSTGLYPKASATRSYRLDTRTTYEQAHLEKYCLDQQLSGGMSENLVVVLDAIIDGQLEDKSE